MEIKSKLLNGIPFKEFNYGQNRKDLIFLHANAFPPECYLPLFNELGIRFNIICPLFKPLWEFPGSPNKLLDWSPLKEDVLQFINSLSNNNYFISGHSLGGHVALRIALENSEKVKKSVLLDPVIFSKWMIFIWSFIQWTDFGERHHPMIKACKNQRLIHNSKMELVNRYRTKKIFSKISDGNLSILIDGLVKERNDGKVGIIFPKDWEIQIYRTGMIADKFIWKNIKKLNNKILLLHAEKTNAPLISVINKLAKKSNYITPEILLGHTHFFPFENPELIGRKMIDFFL
jgi:pimeloyl-ACP methyl ester carboxylesterase